MLSKKAIMLWVFSTIISVGMLAIPNRALAHGWDHDGADGRHQGHDNGRHEGWYKHHGHDWDEDEEEEQEHGGGTTISNPMETALAGTVRSTVLDGMGR